MKAGVPAKIQTGHLSNSNVERYRYHNTRQLGTARLDFKVYPRHAVERESSGMYVVLVESN
jgi:hypothetical protein